MPFPIQVSAAALLISLAAAPERNLSHLQADCLYSSIINCATPSINGQGLYPNACPDDWHLYRLPNSWNSDKALSVGAFDAQPDPGFQRKALRLVA